MLNIIVAVLCSVLFWRQFVEFLFSTIVIRLYWKKNCLKAAVCNFNLKKFFNIFVKIKIMSRHYNVKTDIM